MSKIICDVCGTSYPETSTQCPICGCVRNIGGNSVFSDTENTPAENNGYTYVKGGRFSKSNVKKRAKGGTVTPQKQDPPQRQQTKNIFDNKVKKNTGLVVAILVILLVVVSVVLFFAIRYFSKNMEKPSETAASTTQAADIPCEGIKLNGIGSQIELEVGSGTLLTISRTPSNTTDSIYYDSSDESVATVSASGFVDAVGAGRTVITVACGEHSLTVTVICESEGDDSTAAPDSTSSETSAIELEHEEIRLTRVGETITIYIGSEDTVPAESIVWTSDNESVAVINKYGMVRAIGSGETTVRGIYMGREVACSVVCDFDQTGQNGSDDPDVTGSETTPGLVGNGGVSEDGGDEADSSGSCRLNNIWSDLSEIEGSANVGDSFPIQLLGADGKAVDAQWYVQDENVCTVDESSEAEDKCVYITCVGSGDTMVIATYEGKTYEFHVIVW